MKLSSKYSRVNSLAIIIVVLLGSVSYYFFIRNAFNHQLNKDLRVKEREVTDYIKYNHSLPISINYIDEQEIFTPAGDENFTRQFNEVTIFDKAQNENIAYRQLRFPVNVSGENFIAVVRKSRVETEDLIQLILESTLLMVVTLLICLFLLNRFLLNKLWMPFRSTLEQMKQFNLSGKHTMRWQKTGINEFKELNDAAEIMITRANQDYSEIKGFTENASHEIQTPLAIIQSKLELLTQSEHFTEEEMGSLKSIYDATNRLSKLNQSLILLTKIDNKQFRETDRVNLSLIIKKHLYNYEELIEANGIRISVNIVKGVILMLNETLAEILISNLFTNAIKHNYEGGSIDVILDKTQLQISNTGSALQGDPTVLFERFKKARVSSESLGLGLSIVKRICDRYAYKINYHYEGSVHKIIIDFI